MFKWLFGSDDTVQLDVVLNVGQKHSFRARTVSDFKNNNLSVMSNTSDYLFDVTFLGDNKGHYIFDWNVTYKKMFQGMEYLSEHFDILHRMLSIKDHLVLEVDRTGEILKVKNKEELHDKWLALKNEVVSNPDLVPIAESYLNQFFADGDKEFSTSYPLHEILNEDQLFSVFFKQFSRLNNKYGNEIIRREERSSLFIKDKDQPLTIPVLQTSNWNEVDGIFQFDLSESADNSRLAKGRIRDFLLSMQMVDPELKKYVYEHLITYRIAKVDSGIMEVRSVLSEQINNNLEMMYECQIVRIYE